MPLVLVQLVVMQWLVDFLLLIVVLHLTRIRQLTLVFQHSMIIIDLGCQLMVAQMFAHVFLSSSNV